MSNICEINNLTFAYQTGKEILSNISFSVTQGEIVGILGKNGCGKTTLLNIIAGFLPARSGSLFINGKNIKEYKNIERAQTISYIQQNKISIPNYYCVEDYIIEGCRPFRPFGFYKKDDYNLLDKVMKACNLQTYKSRLIKELSGGEVQRCIFAKAIMKQSNFFLFDEPCSAMDIKYQQEFFKIAHNVKKSLNAGIILTIHDINLAVNNCDRLIVLEAGNIIYDGEARLVTSEIIASAFDIQVSDQCTKGKYFFYQ